MWLMNSRQDVNSGKWQSKHGQPETEIAKLDKQPVLLEEDREDYRQAEERFFDEGCPNSGELPWSRGNDRTPRIAPIGSDDEGASRYRTIRRILRWLEVSANLAQIAAAAAGILTLYLTIARLGQ